MFQLAAAHNNAAGLADLTPQPRPSGPLFALVTPVISLAAYRDGPLYRLYWDYLTTTTLAANLTVAGAALTDKSVEVTARLLTATAGFATFANYNATLILPDFEDGFQHDRGKYLNIVWTLIGLAAL
jgi:hypothetical protein